ncbi:MAG: CatB-related O-acetyltransferase [Bauldia sp.]
MSAQLAATGHVAGTSIKPADYYFEPHSMMASPVVRTGGSRVTNFIGAYSYVNPGGYLRDGVLIGRYCSIGRRVTIAAGAHNMKSLSTSPRIKGTPSRSYSAEEAVHVHIPSATPGPTIIESDVWIGDGAVIRPGVRLGVGAVIGANAVVLRDVAPYEIVGGVAARSLGFRFAPEVIADLLATAWWECDLPSINAMPAGNVFDFLARFTAAAPPRHEFPTFCCADTPPLGS